MKPEFVAGPPIAERIFQFQEDDGTVVEVRVSVMPPRQSSDGWRCDVHITGGPTNKTFRINGEDSLQALVLGMRFCISQITALQKQFSDKIKWSGSTDLTVGLENL